MRALIGCGVREGGIVAVDFVQIWQVFVTVIVFALLPTFVAFIVDQTPGKNALFCVGSLNMCGVLPYLFDLWTGDNSMDAAILILTDVFSLVVIFFSEGAQVRIYLTKGQPLASANKYWLKPLWLNGLRLYARR